MKIVVSHRGFSGNSDLEPSSLSPGSAGASGLSLSQDESDAPFYGVSVFEGDDGSGDFDQALDSEVASQVPPLLSDGDLVLGIPDGDSRLQVTPSLERTLFVEVAFASGAGPAMLRQSQIAHRAADFASEDRTHGAPLLIEHTVDLSSGLVTAVPRSLAHRGIVPRIYSRQM